ncbi:MAG: putative lactoylglutathione lyase [Ignavibacteria bacterium]|nr:putative lactoylglutathione lyase [Ignavibacteria bacterium]
MATQLYANLPVKNLQNTIDFFTMLGFTFNTKFTDANATCMIIGENIYVMLLVEPFYKTFVDKEICDSSKATEIIMAVTCESREMVDEKLSKVVEAGGTETRQAQDHGWMYSRSFQDIDGHLWEFFYMDESAMP